MPQLRKNIKKGKFSNYGKSIFTKSTNNTKYFAEKTIKQPTMRGAFPKSIKVSLNSDSSKPNMSSLKAERKSVAFYSRPRDMDFTNMPAFEGTAARRVDAVPKTIPAPRKRENKLEKPKVQAVKGRAAQKNIMQTSALSPTLVTFAKFAAVIVVFIAIVAFVRVGLSAATISKGIESQQINAQINKELVNKNGLEVQDSTLGNSSKVRASAEKLGMVSPNIIEPIKLDKDVVAQDEEGNLSLVKSLNRLASSAK